MWNRFLIPLRAVLIALTCCAGCAWPVSGQPAPGQKSDIDTLLDAGNRALDNGKYEEAYADYQQAALSATSRGDMFGQARAFFSMGRLAGTNGNFGQAESMMKMALERFRSVGSPENVAGTLTNLGRIYVDTARPGEAQVCLQEALKIFGEAGTRNRAVALDLLGQAYLGTNQPATALRLLKQAVPIFEANRDSVGKANALLDQGAACFNSGDTIGARNAWQETQQLAHQAGVGRLEAAAQANLASLITGQGRPKEATEAWKSALDACTGAGDEQGEAIALANIGRGYYDGGNLDEAYRFLNRALPLCQKQGDAETEIGVLADLAGMEAQQGSLSEATQHYTEAIGLSESLQADLGGYSEARSRLLQDKLRVYYGALTVALRRKQEEKAFELAQKTKARMLLDLMAYGRVDLSRDLTAEESRQEKALRDGADNLNRQMVREGVENEVGAKKRFAALQEELRQVESALKDFTDKLYSLHPHLAEKRVARTAILDDMASALPPDTALLEYVVTSSTEVTLFVVRQRNRTATVQAFSLPLDYSNLAQDAAALRQACSTPDGNYAEGAKRLYTELVAPAMSALQGAKRLVICPDQALWDVPFAVLLAPDGKTFLAEPYELTYAYSATGLLAARAIRADPRRPQPTGTLLALANPEFGDVGRFGDLKGVEGQRPFELPSRPFELPSRPFELPSRPIPLPSRALQGALEERGGRRIAPLPGTEMEAKALRTLFPDAALYTGTEAQEEVFKREAGRYRYLHIATHAFLNDAAPMLSSIVLAVPPQGSTDDGFLTAREISELNLHADLVTLSACNTARGEERSGEGVIGLSWALLVAGVPAQVVSQWSVDDMSTATLMADLYRGLKAGQGKAEALQEAEAKLRQDSRYRHPYYWAPFLLIGDGGQAP